MRATRLVTPGIRPRGDPYQWTPGISLAMATCSARGLFGVVGDAAGGGGVGEDAVGDVEDAVDGLGRECVGDLAERAEAGVDRLGLGADRLADHAAGLFGGDRRELVVHLRRRDHLRAHERHVDRRERHAVADHLRRHHPRPRVQRRLRRHVGREARRVGLHADRRDVDDVAAAALAHVREQQHRQPDRAEVVELHRALEVVEAVERQRDRAADRAAGVVDEDVDRRMLVEHLGDQSPRSRRGRTGRTSRCTRCRRRRRSPGASPRACRRCARRAAGCRRPPRSACAAALPMPDDAPVMQHRLAVDRAGERPVACSGRGRGDAPSSTTAARSSSRARAPRCRCPTAPPARRACRSGR